MKKITLTYLLLTTYIFSHISAVVSILPQQIFLKAIAGDKVSVSLMVQPGNSPHTYEPKPSQMIDIARASLYFTIDVEFENVWLPKFRSLNPKMKIINLSDGIEKIHIDKRDTKEQHNEHEHKDPHIWTSPSNVKIIAQTIYNALQVADPKNTNYYKANLDTFLTSIDKTDLQIKQIFASLKKERRFMVFHPSWGYFAKSYNLEQVSVEFEGKEPKPKELIHLLKEAKKYKIRAIFTQPEFSDIVANIIAKELKIPVIKISPLAPNWSSNLINIANAIVGKN